MKNIFLPIVFLISMNISLFAQNSLFERNLVYWSDRDNIYPNGFVNALAIQDDILYTLLDTGDTGVAKLFKIKKNYKYKGHFEIDTTVYDNSIEWQIYFGNENKYILREHKLCFLTESGNIRIVLLQKNDDFSNPRIIDVSPDGEIIYDKLLNLTLGLDAMLLKLDENTFVSAFTGIISNDKSIVKVLKFNTNEEIFNNKIIEDNLNSIKITNLQYNSKNNELGVVTASINFDCYWNVKFSAFDININQLYEFSPNLNVAFHHTVLGKRFNGDWIMEVPYISLQDTSVAPSPLNPSYIERRYFMSKDSIIDVPYKNDYYHNWVQNLYVSEAYLNVFVKIGNRIFNNFKRCFNSENSVIAHSVNIKDGGSSGGGLSAPSGFTNHKNTLTNIYEVSDTKHYALAILGDSSVVVVEFNIFNVTSMEDVQNSNFISNNYSFFVGNKAIIPVVLDGIEVANVFIFDSMGNKIRNEQGIFSGNKMEIPIHHLTNGVYFYYIPEQNIRGKFGVMR